MTYKDIQKHFTSANSMECNYCGELCNPECLEEHLDGCEHLPPDFPDEDG